MASRCPSWDAPTLPPVKRSTRTSLGEFETGGPPKIGVHRTTHTRISLYASQHGPKPFETDAISSTEGMYRSNNAHLHHRMRLFQKTRGPVLADPATLSAFMCRGTIPVQVLYNPSHAHTPKTSTPMLCSIPKFPKPLKLSSSSQCIQTHKRKERGAKALRSNPQSPA